MVRHLGEIKGTLKAGGDLVFSIALFSAIVNLLMLTGPLYMLQLYDRVLASRSVHTLIALTALVAFLFLMMGVLDYIRSRVLVRLGAQYQMRMESRVFENTMKIAVLNSSSRAHPSTGLRDLDAIQRFLSGPGAFFVFDAPWTPVYLSVLFVFHWLLGLFAVMSGVLIVTVAVLNQMLTRNRQAKSTESSEALHHFGERLRAGAETVIGLGMLSAAASRISALKKKSVSAEVGLSDQGGAFSTFSKTMRIFLQSMMLGLGAWLAIRSEVTPGVMIAASILLGRALAPIDLAVGQWPAFQRALGAYRKIRELLSVLPEESSPIALPEPEASLSCEDLVVQPAGIARPLVHRVSFSVLPGAALGITGPSGSGKSCLAKALAGVWPVQAGKVCLGGASLDQYGQETLASHVGWLPQEAILFDGTVAENIARMATDLDTCIGTARGDASSISAGSQALALRDSAGGPPTLQEMVVSAALMTGSHQMILNLPGGYEFRVGPGGSSLSGGQRQRICLARAFFGAPKVVILDEPDAHLDAAGCDALNGAVLAHTKRNGAAVIIAHRNSAFENCDEILIMEQGTVTRKLKPERSA